MKGVKRAKLAHDKDRRSQSPSEKSGPGEFTFKRVVEVVDFQIDGVATTRWAVVDLDGSNTLGLVDSMFTVTAKDGSLEPGPLACPAVYDRVRRGAAILRYRSYSETNGNAAEPAA